jgi:hypothetical protein
LIWKQDLGLALKQVDLDCYDPTQAPQQRGKTRDMRLPCSVLGPVLLNAFSRFA